VWDIESGEEARGFAHDIPVALAAHHDGNCRGGGHWIDGEDNPARVRGV
jgi:hypothetical protein